MAHTSEQALFIYVIGCIAVVLLAVTIVVGWKIGDALHNLYTLIAETMARSTMLPPRPAPLPIAAPPIPEVKRAAWPNVERRTVSVTRDDDPAHTRPTVEVSGDARMTAPLFRSVLGKDAPEAMPAARSTRPARLPGPPARVSELAAAAVDPSSPEPPMPLPATLTVLPAAPIAPPVAPPIGPPLSAEEDDEGEPPAADTSVFDSQRFALANEAEDDVPSIDAVDIGSRPMANGASPEDSGDDDQAETQRLARAHLAWGRAPDSSRTLLSSPPPAPAKGQRPKGQ